jgi:hypothetical protein
MGKTWSITDGDGVECLNCGAIYSVKITKLPVKEKNLFNCRDCGYLIHNTNSTSSSDFTLITAGRNSNNKI